MQLRSHFSSRQVQVAPALQVPLSAPPRLSSPCHTGSSSGCASLIGRGRPSRRRAFAGQVAAKRPALANHSCAVHLSQLQSGHGPASSQQSLRQPCWLTNRSTGPIAACRHLPRHFILGQMPSHHNVPVSSNVRQHTRSVCGDRRPQI